MKKIYKRVIAFFLVFIMCFGLFQGTFGEIGSELSAFIEKAQQEEVTVQEKNEPESPVSSDKVTSREDAEELAGNLGGNKNAEDIEAMDDKALGQYLEELFKKEDKAEGESKKPSENKKPLSDDDRKDLEQIADMVSDGKEDIKDMTDTELQDYVESELGKLDTNTEVPKVENLGKDETSSEIPEIDPEDKKDDYNEDGSMNKPFDEIYPELMDTEVVEYDDETLLIKMSNRFDGKVTSEMKKAGVAAVEMLFAMEESSWYEAFLKKGTDVTEAVAALREIKSVQLVEYNYSIKTAAMDDYEELDKNITSNALVAQQWHLNYCGFKKGTKELTNPGGSPSVVVAVIDTGVDYDHEDLADNIWVNDKEVPDNGRDDDGNGYVDDYYGVNIVAGKGNGDDDNGHGTHVAGIIAAKNNHLGTVGIAYNTKIMSIKAAMASGYLNQSDIVKAINYAYENGAEVINMSFGGTACTIAVQDALANAYTRCVLVASAGNDASVNEGFPNSVPNYPAALSYVLGVMSVGRNGMESSFTNFDYSLYSNTEYELYAPGEEILSTVPDNKYASWSGTSMAAPVVSAIAALLRSEYTDRNTYPTKFIYGQLTATSENQAICPGHPGYMLEPYAHNVPDITNLYTALTKLPKPDVGLSDYYVFDTKGFEYDEKGKNNGDGVIDAGETLALGLILRNRWGMSKNTTVTIDTLSVAGIPDPYIEIFNPTVDYGSIGTYSTGDCGKIFEDELFSGWENPFYVRIAEDCPNDYIFRVNVNVTAENALDEKDDAVYSSGSSILLTVRNGYILPAVIEEDMTLTPDNLYIIPNATTIRPGVTVTVKPGTNIQMWSDDAEDPYASEYIAYLRVEGDFLVEGTEEEPVYIYPSDLMSNYIVNIYKTGSGYVSLKHADITNFGGANSTGLSYNYISYASDCTFRKNYGDDLYFRYLNGGQVNISGLYSLNIASFGKAENCTFYKLSSNYSNQAYISGNFNGCAFIDCGINLSNSTGNKFTNCLFYGNNFNERTSPSYYVNSSYTAKSNPLSLLSPSDFTLVYVEETGATYVAVYKSSFENYDYVERLGWKYAIFETEEELRYLQKKKVLGDSYTIGVKNNGDGTATWYDGTPVGDFIGFGNYYTYGYFDVSSGKIDPAYNSWDGYLFEFPGEIYVTDISFDEYEVDIDLETDYLIRPVTLPVPFAAEDLIFESTDEGVATVDETGLVTPVSKGTADIYVYSEDRAVRNYVTVNVVDYVPLENISFTDTPEEIEVGTSFNLAWSFEPANTTRKNVKFASSDPEIISVSEKGIITGLKRGQATITVSCEGITDEFTVYSYKKAESLRFTKNAEVYFLSQGSAEIPALSYGDADPLITYESTDESVIAVEDGRLTFGNSGRAVLRATDERTGLQAEITLYVTSDDSLPGIKKIEGSVDNALTTLILYEDGIRSNNPIYNDVVDMSICRDDAAYEIYLKNDGTIVYEYIEYFSKTATIDSLENIVSVSAGYNTFFAIDENGICYAWGSNLNCCSGTGYSGNIAEPMMVNLENVKEVYSSHHGSVFSYFLTDDGSLYFAGGPDGQSIPKLVAAGISDIEQYGSDGTYVLKSDGLWYWANQKGEVSTSPSYKYDNDGTTPGYIIKEGKPYYYSYDTEYLIPGIDNAVDIKSLNGQHSVTYILCEDNTLYGYGAGFRLGNGSSDNTVSSDNAVIVPTFNYEKPSLAVENINLNGSILEADTLTVDFNGKLKSYSALLYADGKQIPFKLSGDFDKMFVSLADGFKENVFYELVISPNNVSCGYLASMENTVNVSFVYKAPYVSEIILKDKEVTIDTEMTYTAGYETRPIPLPYSELIFESADESIATVDEKGVVTPVSKGTVDIKVYPKAKNTCSTVRVNVVDYVPLEAVDFTDAPEDIEIGTSHTLTYALTPANTIRRNVTFTSSDPEIISVDESGVITANSRGSAVITVIGEDVTDEITVYAYKKAETFTFLDAAKVYTLNQEKVDIPALDYGESDPIITYKSTDESVVTVKDDKLLIIGSGYAFLRATDERSGLSSEITLCVAGDDLLPAIKAIDGMPSDNSYNPHRAYVLYEDGRVCALSDGSLIIEDVAQMSINKYNDSYRIFLKNDGTVVYGYDNTVMQGLSDIVKVIAGYGTYFAIDKDGICYAWGSNGSCCSGTGLTGELKEPTMVNLENVVEVCSSYLNGYFTYFLTSDGSLYYSGSSDYIATPVKKAENIENIIQNDDRGVYALIDGDWYWYTYEGGRNSDPAYTNDTDGKSPGYFIVDGKFKNGINNVVDVVSFKSNYSTEVYIICEDNTVLKGVSAPVIVPTFSYNKAVLTMEKNNIKDSVLYDDALYLDFNGKLSSYSAVLYADGKQVPCSYEKDFDTASVFLSSGFKEGVEYKIVISKYSLRADYLSAPTEDIVIEFTYDNGIDEDAVTEPEETTTEVEETTTAIEETTTEAEETTTAVEETTTVIEETTTEVEEETTKAPTEPVVPEAPEEPAEPEEPVVHLTQVDDTVERFYYNVDDLCEEANAVIKSFNPYFHHNVILNRISTDYDVEHWLRVLAPTSSTYSETAIGYNYWGSVNERAIGLQLIDYTDFQTYSKFNYAPFLTEAPENTFPFVTDVKIFNAKGEEVTTVGNEKITVRVSFNRDMEESIPLLVRFGSAYPYGDYEIEGKYVDARTWEGTTTLTTIIENGNQYFTISEGKAKGTALDLYTDRYRFGFVIDTTAAQALIMQGNATDEGVELTWTQDDFDTLMGYNVYRSTSEDGYYQRLNSSVIPADIKTFTDTTVEPGVVYYYNFTVVKTDLTESTPSGKISIMSKDTMAPNVYHTPVYTAFTGSNIIISATVTDNLFINTATVYYRTVGTEEWKMAVMNNLNSKYSAIIFADEVTVAGVEYYIDAFDGISHTYKGSAENPYVITVQEAIGDDALGDVNGDGKITNLDALMLLQAINDVLNLDSEQFARADLNGDGTLVAAEALRILQYVSGTVGSVRM